MNFGRRETQRKAFVHKLAETSAQLLERIGDLITYPPGTRLPAQPDAQCFIVQLPALTCVCEPPVFEFSKRNREAGRYHEHDRLDLRLYPGKVQRLEKFNSHALF